MDSASALPLAVIEKKAPEKIYTLGEYIEFDEQHDERYEYFNGIIRKLPMAKGAHNKITANIIRILGNKLIEQNKGYQVFASQQKVYMPKLNVSLYPDTLVVAEKQIYFDDNEQLLVNQILIVEVLSPGTRHYDQVDKFRKYKTLESLNEYVLVETEMPAIETRFRKKANLWQIDVTEGLDALVRFESIGCAVDLGEVYRGVEL